MANVRLNLPDGREIDVDEDLLADPEVNQQFQDLYDIAEGPISLGENIAEKGKDFARGIFQGVAAVPKYVALKAKEFDQDLPAMLQSYEGKTTKDLQSYKVGEWIEKIIPPTDVRVRGTMASQVATGLGQVAGSVASALVTKNIGVAAVQGVGMQAAEDYERATTKGATELEAQQAADWGGVWGVTDLLPLGNALNILKKAGAGKMGLAKDALGQFFVEGGQEGFQQFMSNVTAKMTYDDQQKLAEEVLPSATVGGIVGAISGTILNMLGAKGKVKIGPTNVAGEAEGSAMAEVEKLRARGIGTPVQETVTETPAEVVPSEPTTVDTMQANEAGELSPSQTFAKQMLEAGRSEDEVHVNLSLLNVIAQTRGMDLDTFVEKSIAGVQSGETTPEGDDVLEQRIHPAPYPNSFVKIFSDILQKEGSKNVLDIFGGIGRIGEVKKYGFEGTVAAKDIEPGWGSGTINEMTKRGVDIPLVGDSRDLKEFQDNSQDALVFSPTYGNLMGRTSPSVKDSYQGTLGKPLQEGNTGGFVWSPQYEQLHKEIYAEAVKKLSDTGIVILNVKDFPDKGNNIRKGSTVKKEGDIVKGVDWHIQKLEELGLTVSDRIKIPVASALNKLHEAQRRTTVPFEEVVILRKHTTETKYDSTKVLESISPTFKEVQQSHRYVKSFIDSLPTNISNIDFLEKYMDFVESNPADIFTINKLFPKKFVDYVQQNKELSKEKLQELSADILYQAQNNASGQTDTSLEATGELASRQRKGVETFKIDTRSNKALPAIGIRPEDNSINAHEVLVQRWPSGKVVELQRGRQARSNYTLPPQQLNQSLSTNNGQSTSQVQGSVNFLEDGRAVITLMSGSDQSTMLHEIGHVLRRWLSPEEMVTANEFVGATTPKWSVEQEEMWARGWERYLRRGKAPTIELKDVFEKMKTWLRRIYKTIKGSEIDVKLDPKTIALFDKILTPAAFPSQKAEHELTFEAWKIVYGEDKAAMFGLTNKSISVRSPSRFNSLVNAISGGVGSMRSIIFSRYMTPGETQAQLAIVSDPTYLQRPLANRDIDGYVVRVLNLFAVRANSAFHLGESVAPILEELQAQKDSAERKGLFDNDLGVMYKDEYMDAEGFVTRRMNFDSTIKFVTQLSEVQQVRESWNTPAREQLLAIKHDIYHGTQDVIMDRTTGHIYAVEQKGVHSASMVDVDRGTVRRVPISELYTQFVWPELIKDDKDATLTKDEWMAEKHYQVVNEALENGESVPSYAIAPHLTKDPMLQEAFDKAKALEDSLDGTTQQNSAIDQLFQETQNEELGDRIVEPIHVGAAAYDILPDLEIIGRITEEAQKELTRLAHVLDFEDGPQLTDLVKKTEIQRLARETGKINDLPVEEYLAEIFSELDTFKEVVSNRGKDLDVDSVARMSDRIGHIYTKLKQMTESIEDNGQGRMLEGDATVDYIRKMYHWGQRTLLHKEPSRESTAGNLFEKAFFTMQGLSWRHPILKPLFKLAIHRINKATKVAHDLFLGKPEEEVVEFETAKGVAKIKLRNPGLRTLKSLDTNSEAYNAMRSLILLGDNMRTQFTLDEIMLGVGGRVDALIAEAEDATDPAEQELLTQKATAFMALDQILSRRSVEERKQAALAYFEIQDTLQYMYFKTKRVLVDILGQSGENVMKHIAPNGFIPGYFPHMRFGKYGVLVKSAETNKTKYFTAFEDWASQTNALKELKQKFPNDVVVNVDTSQKLEYQIGGGQDLITALQDVIGRTKLNEVIQDKDALAQVQDMLFDTTSEMIKAQGIFSMFKERTEIPGFDERISMVMHKRVTDFASAIAKIEFASKGAQELASVRSNTNLYNYAKEWFGAMLEGADSSDAWIGKIRAAIYLKHLGFNIKTAFVMTMDKLTNAPSVLGRYTDSADKKILSAIPHTMRFMSWLHQIEKQMNVEGISRTDAIQSAGLPEGFDEETVNAMLWSKDTGATLAKFAPEVFAHEEMTWESGRSGQSQVGKSLEITKFMLGKVFDKASWMGSKVEELNKMSTFLAAFKTFRNEKEYQYDRALDVAQDVVNDAHVVYGRANIPLPFLRKGIWKYTRLAYVFRAFEHNYAQLLFNLSTVEGTRGKLMAIRSMAVLMAVAGVPALPFITPLFKLYGISTGDDPEQWFRKTINKITGTEWGAKIFSDGLPSVGHVTLRGSLQVGAYENWEDIIAGVAGSTVKDIAKAGSQAKNGDWDGFSKTAMPAALSNLYKSHQGATTGVMTEKGNPLREGLIGAPIKYTGLESLMKAASFSIEREATAQRLKVATIRENDYWTSKRASIYTKFAKGARLDDKAYIQSALEDAVAYERERAKARAIDIPPLSRQGLKQSLSESGLNKKQVLQVLRMTGRLP
jgi:hypothetical protein